jgi:long-chain acyl-CoA synthetase
MQSIKRTFDILTYCEAHYDNKYPLSVKRGEQWERVSAAEYRQNVDSFSLGLMKMGFQKGDKIATVMHNRPEWNFIDFGMSQIGCVHVSIYPTISDVEYEHILGHSDARILIISSKDLYDKIFPIASKVKSLEEIYTIDQIEGVKNWTEIQESIKDDQEQLKPLQKLKDDIDPEDLLTLIYTSGTTGLSKGVMLTHHNVVSNIKIAEKLVPYLKTGDRALSFLPLCHILERVGNYLWQYKGLLIHYPESMDGLGENMKEIKVNTFITVPRVFEKVYDKIINKGRSLKGIKKILFFWAVRVGDKFDPDPKKRSAFYNFKLKIANKLIFSKWREALGGELKGVISGGAALQPRLARVFWSAGIIVQEGYGLTETSPLISANNYHYPGVKFGSVGFVPDGIEVKIAEDGEILARGENIMKGYYKDEAQTREVIDPEGWFHTGDIGHLDEEDLLHITDRKKEMFKLSGGKYVAPQHVENKMKESQFIDQILVVGDNQKFTAAIVVPDFVFLHNWCFLHKVHYHDNKDLISKPRILERFQREIDRLNEELGQVEKIKKFKLVKDEWSVENALLSPTQKLRRKKITAHYTSLIDEIYAEA